MFCSSLSPGGVHCHVLVTRRRQDMHQLIQDGWQELNHHVTLHGMETLTKRGGNELFFILVSDFCHSILIKWNVCYICNTGI